MNIISYQLVIDTAPQQNISVHDVIDAEIKIGGTIGAIEEENGGSSSGSAVASASENKLDITNFPKGPLFESASAATNGPATNGGNGGEASESLEEKCH